MDPAPNGLTSQEATGETDRKCLFSVLGKHRQLGGYNLEPREVKLRLPDKVDKHRFQLGNGRYTEDVEEAANVFVEREYPEVLRGRDNPPIFIPELFITKAPGLLFYNLKEDKEGYGAKRRKKYENNGILAGDFSESRVFYMLKNLLETEVDIAVFHGYRIHSSNADCNKKLSEGETDFLILSHPHRMIVSIECKSEMSNTNCGHALKQLHRTHNFLEENLSLGTGWKFFKVCAFHGTWTKSYICSLCKCFVVCDELNMDCAWKTILRICSRERNAEEESRRNEYVEHFKRLAFLMHTCYPNEPVTKCQITQKMSANINKASSSANIILWTRQQHATFLRNEKKVLLLSPYGTGKTILLKEKALALSLEGTSSSKSRLIVDAAEEVEDFDTIYFLILYPKFGRPVVALAEMKAFFEQGKKGRRVKVFTWDDVVRDVGEDNDDKFMCNSDILSSFVIKHKNSLGIFVDEYPNALMHVSDTVSRSQILLSRGLKRDWPIIMWSFLNHGEVRNVLKKLVDLFVSQIIEKKAYKEKEAAVLPQNSYPSLLLLADLLLLSVASIIFSRFLPMFINLTLILVGLYVSLSYRLTFSALVNLYSKTGNCGYMFVIPMAIQLMKISGENLCNRDRKRQYVVDDLLDEKFNEKLKEIISEKELENAIKITAGYIEKYSMDYFGGEKSDPETAVAFLDSLATQGKGYLWIALNKDDHVFKWSHPWDHFKTFERFTNFKCPELHYNLRNTQEIIKLAKEELGGIEKSTLDYLERENKLQGFQPMIIHLKLKTPNKLIKAFSSAWSHLATHGLNDLLILWSDTAGPAFDILLEEIVRQCHHTRLPVYFTRKKNRDSDEVLNKCQKNGWNVYPIDDAAVPFFKAQRRGVVIGDLASVQGVEFTSLLAFLPLDERGRRNFHRDYYYFLQHRLVHNIILRTMCNLVIVEYEE